MGFFKFAIVPVISSYWVASLIKWLLSDTSQQSAQYLAETIIYALVALSIIFAAKVAYDKGDTFRLFLFAAVAAILTAWSF